MAFISYSDVLDGVYEQLQNLTGFVQTNDDDEIVNLLKYEPKVVNTTPLIYMLLDTAARQQKGQQTHMRYRVLIRLVLQWQENDQSELQLIPLVNEIPYRIDQDPTLGGRVNMGLAQIGDIQSGFVVISGTKYRCCDFYLDCETKSAVKSGI